MKITDHLFEAFLKCPTKCWLRATNETPTGNTYAEWVKTQNKSYRVAESKRLLTRTPPADSALSPPADNLKVAKWRLAVDITLTAPDLPRSCRRQEAHSSVAQPATLNSQPSDQSRVTSAANDQADAASTTFTAETLLHAVQRVPAEGKGKAAQFIPIRFIFTNKLGKDDRLLLAFDAVVLSAALGREIAHGKIVHGDNHATLKVKASALVGEVRKRLKKIDALLSSPTPPDLVLNRHCAECEFQARCRQKAIEKDDLSLLAGMNEKERKKLRSKGIFTVTQLSYTFRPRRRSKRLRDKKEKYHHSLKALAIREKKIHIVGRPELKIEGTPVYLDVEGLPDRDFYYLIGLRIGNGESAIQHSLWADTVEDEGKIWSEFLGILETVDKATLIHYGSYETTFLKQMKHRHGAPPESSVASKAIGSALNLVSVMFARIYFPTFTNGLKEIANSLGFTWSLSEPSGVNAIRWRHMAEESKDSAKQDLLIAYNSDDCKALELVARAIAATGGSEDATDTKVTGESAVSVESLKARETMWPKFKSPFREFEQVNEAARWDYQRDRLHVRSSRRARCTVRRGGRTSSCSVRIAKVIEQPGLECCPTCHRKPLTHLGSVKRVLYDLKIGKCSLQRRNIEYRYDVFWCSKCRIRLGVPTEFWPKSKYSRNLVAYLLYQVIELCIPMGGVVLGLNRVLGFNLTQQVVHNLKHSAAMHYKQVQQSILKRLVSGDVLHVDETRVSVKGKTACVWVLTNLYEVSYLYSDAREGEFVQDLLKDFKGVLVSDFFSAYDSIDCPQQKCLIHLIRDLNTEVLNQPYDQELRQVVRTFAELLKPMIETVDHYG